MPLRIHLALDHWREVERALAETPIGSSGRHDAEEAVAHARAEYLATVAAVAVEQGPGAMPDLTEAQVQLLEHLRRDEG